MQYSLISFGNTLSISDSGQYFRYRSMPGQLELDKTLTGIGFFGAEGVDWENIENITSLGTGLFRLGVRDSKWNIDEALDATGFAGTEGVNWTNMENHTLGIAYLEDPTGQYIYTPTGYRIVLPT